MSRLLFALAACSSLMASSSAAAALTLTVERSTGETWLENLSDGTVVIDGYLIVSTAALLDPGAWRSLEDWISADPPAAQSVLGTLAWGEFVARPSDLIEVNLAGETSANPGFRVSLGHPVASVVAGELKFYFSDFTKPPAQRNTEGEVRYVNLPAPAAGVLALLGAPALLLGSWRRSRASRAPIAR